MKKMLAFYISTRFFIQDSSAQTKTIRSKGIGVSFILNDFVTPARIRSSSLSAVLRDEKFAKIKEMNPGLAISYFKGFIPHIDFAATLGGSFVNMPLGGKPSDRDFLLLEADASANFKMFAEGEVVINPYLIAGIGASKYTDVYGAFIPLGGGLKSEFVNDTQIFLQFQYRIPVTPEANNYHFQFSLGVSGSLGKKRM